VIIIAEAEEKLKWRQLQNHLVIEIIQAFTLL
jgi:hypothetical protein